jgi:hypothetical protein
MRRGTVLRPVRKRGATVAPEEYAIDARAFADALREQRAM